MIKNTDKDYSRVVEITVDKKQYKIDTNKVILGEEIQCPTDDTMTITKTLKDECIIKKRCRFNPFG